MNEIKTATIGKGKAIHAAWGTDRTYCKRNHNDWNAALPVECDADAITCKSCLKAIAAEVEQAHAEAIAMDEERATAPVEAEVQVERAVERQRSFAHLEVWFSADGSIRYCDVLVPGAKILENDAHQGPCFDAMHKEWREERSPSRRERKAARREQRAKLRRVARCSR